MQLYKFNEVSTFAAVVLAGVTSSVSAGPITQNQVIGERNILGHSLIGQTFTAQETQISTIGFHIRNSSHVDPGGNDFSYNLLAGAGTSGLLVSSMDFTLPEGFSGFANVDFSSVTLTMGQQYTVLITAPDFDWVVSWNQFADDQGPIPDRVDYFGGEAIWLGEIIPNADLTFQVQPIPEPATSTLLLLTATLFAFKACHNRLSQT